jgi:sugar phosphate isomerase/epimerase
MLISAAVAATSAVPSASSAAAAPAERSPLVLFTKILDRMSTPELVRTLKDIGFDGLDLTVRRNGHVEPAKVEQALPEVARLAHEAGLTIPMIATELTSASDPTARPILATAHKVGVQCFKTGYHDYDHRPIFTQIAEFQRDLLGLGELGRSEQMVMGVHNHSGRRWGQAVWDTKETLERMPAGDPAGFYYDPGHATVEGGLGGWQVTLEIALTRMRMMAVKDFLWQKQDGKWDAVWVPLGEGMVHWSEILPLVLKSGYRGPITLDLEYKTQDPVGSVRKDFATLQKLLKDAQQA